MRKAIDWLLGALDLLSRALLGIASLMLVLMFTLINTEIVMRTIFARSTLISDEYGGYLLCWLTLTGLLYCVRTDQLLRVRLVIDRAGGMPASLLNAAAAFGGLFVSSIATYATGLLTRQNWQFNSVTSQYIETPLYIPQAIMPICFALIAVAYAGELLAIATGHPTSATEGGER